MVFLMRTTSLLLEKEISDKKPTVVFVAQGSPARKVDAKTTAKS